MTTQTDSLLSAVFETVLDSIIIINSKGIIERVNPATEKLFGFSASEMVGQNVKMLMPSPYQQSHDQYIENYHQTGEKKIIDIGREVMGQKKDGSQFPLDLTVNDMWVEGEKKFVGTLRDLTEHYAQQQAIADTVERNRNILETILDGVVSINERGIIETVNPAVEKLFGYTSEEMIGQNVSMLMPAPHREAHDGYLNTYLNTGEKRIIGVGREVKGLRKDGSTFPMDLAVGEMTVKGRKMFTGVIKDITERKQHEKMKEEFISTVSHELRTPLTSIKGSLGLVMGTLRSELPEKAIQLLAIAQNNSERLLLLINDILDISKIESGKMDFNFTEVNLTELIEEAIESNLGYASQHNVKLFFNQKLDAKVYGDHDRLIQVLNNLLSNAAKFSPDDSSVEINVVRHHSNVRISVTDSGQGIDKSFQKKLFEKFTQADSSDTRKAGGTGLGLNISKAIVEKHNGHINFVSEVGVGTTFFFDLPEIIKDVTKEVTKKVLSAPLHRSGNILICEDEPDIAKLLRLILAQAGYEADIALNAKEAKALLAANVYSAMTMDVMLPDQDGVSLFEEIRESYDIPVVFVSAKSKQIQQSYKGDLTGIVDWLSKPINEEQLIDAIGKSKHALHQTADHYHLLHVEDDPDIREVIKILLGDAITVVEAPTLKEAVEQLKQKTFNLVLLDIGLPDGSGLDLIQTLRSLKHKPEVLVFSADELKARQFNGEAQTLVKSKTTNQQLVETIMAALKKGG